MFEACSHNCAVAVLSACSDGERQVITRNINAPVKQVTSHPALFRGQRCQCRYKRLRISVGLHLQGLFTLHTATSKRPVHLLTVRRVFQWCGRPQPSATGDTPKAEESVQRRQQRTSLQYPVWCQGNQRSVLSQNLA